jgi:uncharacterized SAM-binding protein YcdF (DUF218 family)
MPLLGLCKRKQLWVPTWRGWALLFGFVVLLVVLTILESVPFLAPTQPIGHGLLVVEGWLPDYCFEEAKQLLDTHPYRLVVVPGIPIEKGFFISKEKNYAQLAAKTFEALGVPAEKIILLPCQQVPRNRTYATACRVRTWLDTQAAPGPVDVFTLGVHARRTSLLYKMALGKNYPVGIIAGHDERYDARLWWKTSNGVRTVTSEIIAYLYAKFLFYPSAAELLESGTH